METTDDGRVVLTAREYEAAAQAAHEGVERGWKGFEIVDHILAAVGETRRPPKGFESMTRFEEVRGMADRDGISVEEAMIRLINSALSDGHGK